MTRGRRLGGFGWRRQRGMPAGSWSRRFACRCAQLHGVVRHFVALVRSLPCQQGAGRRWRAEVRLWTGHTHPGAPVRGWGRTRGDALEAVKTALRNGWPEAGTAWRDR